MEANDNLNIRQQFEASIMLIGQPKPTAADLRRDAELRYDGPIPAEVLATIAAKQSDERAGIVATVTTRELCTVYWRLAKGCFRRQSYFTKPGTSAYLAQWKENRRTAAALLDCWKALRALERLQIGAAA